MVFVRHNNKILPNQTPIQMKKSQMGPKYQTAFDVTPYLRNGLTKREVLELKDAFDLLDPIASGNIDPQELSILFKAHLAGKNRSLELALEELGQSKKGIDFATFLTVFTAFEHTDKKRKDYSRIFKLYDDEKMGCVSGKNLRRVVKELDLQIDESEIQEMIERADLNNDGVITEDQFYLVMTKVSSKV